MTTDNQRTVPVVWNYSYDEIIGGAEVNIRTGEVVIRLIDPRLALEFASDAKKLSSISISRKSSLSADEQKTANPQVGVTVEPEGLYFLVKETRDILKEMNNRDRMRFEPFER